MPNSPEDRKRAITRLRRINGQAEALGRAIEAGTECAPLLQQMVAMRGAVNGLLSEIMETHLHETFGHGRTENQQDENHTINEDIKNVMNIWRTYLK